MGKVDLDLAQSDRQIDPAQVAKMLRSSKPERRKKGRLLQAVLDWRDEHGTSDKAQARGR